MNLILNSNLRRIFGKNIAKFRIRHKLTREKLSLALGVDNSYVSKLERGHVNITLRKMEFLAQLLGADIRDLFNPEVLYEE